jgi:sterol desaturase/sphingolipid hydroxylase (fatty acid hydroxylase superfamily)
MQDAAAALLASKSLIVAAWLILLFVGERLLPAAPRPPDAGAARLMRNLALWAINVVLSPLIVVPVSAWAAGHGLFARPSWWQGLPGFLLDLVILDGLIYGWHRLNHQAPFLWRFHSVHHLDRFLDTTSALRFHFGEVLLSAAARVGVILVLALPLVSIVAFETLVLAAALFHHSNLRLAPRLERVLARLVVTPGIHWVHHHRRQADADANYATILSLWDPLFGSRAATRRTPDMAIGVEGRDEMGLLDLLRAPFQLPRVPASGRGSVQ